MPPSLLYHIIPSLNDHRKSLLKNLCEKCENAGQQQCFVPYKKKEIGILHSILHLQNVSNFFNLCLIDPEEETFVKYYGKNRQCWLLVS